MWLLDDLGIVSGSPYSLDNFQMRDLSMSPARNHELLALIMQTKLLITDLRYLGGS
jgi:hypothetical protein